ncbi:FAD-binding protein [Stigmatella hybrida]|uniref:FAD-binding protein n=1 Tax=Stigmatella hybrida TaxID=394097 RepID=UPI001CDB03B1|nr:FAD-binding protein [Stigmatella hybrida]
MSSPVHPRRKMLQGALAVAAVAFNPLSRSWAATAEPGTLHLPDFDGQLLLDAGTRASAADDFGHIVHRTPWAVLVPGSVEDIVKGVRFARAHHLKVAGTRGIGESHSTHGQAQVEGGIVIDMSALSTIHEIGAASVWVDAGVRWNALLQATVPLGKSPPTLTDYIDLSVGGTLSVGGIGGQVFRHGLQVDNVLELDVVTGRGELVRCSRLIHRPLFDAVRGGLGQFGIIVRARIRLVAVPPRARTYTAVYTDLPRFLADQILLIESGRFDYVEGSVSIANGGRSFQLEAVKYFTPGAEPSDAALLAGLSYQPGTLQVADSSYYDFTNRLAPLIAFLQSSGLWEYPHPWLDMFVPGTAAAPFVKQVLDQTPEAETGGGPILLYPFRLDKLTAPFVRVPPGRHAFLFSLLRTAVPPTEENVAALVAKNQLFVEQLMRVGGRRYAIGSAPPGPGGWREHFEPLWPAFQAAKVLFDPDNVLTPGQRIF